MGRKAGEKMKLGIMIIKKTQLQKLAQKLFSEELFIFLRRKLAVRMLAHERSVRSFIKTIARALSVKSGFALDVTRKSLRMRTK